MFNTHNNKLFNFFGVEVINIQPLV